ncbi:MAG: hypothetical protein GF383_04345 [Candidatus Lokiarchaeota archaeon]|jgi:hypothetical protein|nr:hypothetical protein [Candidatus Lokiarchaeota archaeon]MBD3338990.1 hypothetical protein [Candidatus Lokiarchaeota archaeon]
MAFCGNVLELVKKRKVIEDNDFIQWKEFKGFNPDNHNLEVYIEKSLLPELEEIELILIDVALGEVNGKSMGMLFMKKEKDVYG